MMTRMDPKVLKALKFAWDTQPFLMAPEGLALLAKLYFLAFKKPMTNFHTCSPAKLKFYLLTSLPALYPSFPHKTRKVVSSKY